MVASRPPGHPTAVVALLALSLVVAGCTSGGRETAPRAGSPAPPPSRRPDSGASASSAERPQWEYVALGDSIAAGTGVRRSYVDLFSRAIERDTGATVLLTNLAVGGSTTQDVLALLGGAVVREKLEGAEVVTVTIGANDLARVAWDYASGSCPPSTVIACAERVLAETTERWEQIVLELRALTDGDAIIRVTNYYDPLVAGPLGRAQVPARLGAEGHRLVAEHNRAICQVSESAGVPCADVFAEFNGADGRRSPWRQGLLHPDGVHPSQAGHRLIARTLRSIGYDPLA